MTVLALRVAARYVVASLVQEFRQKMDDLLKDEKLDPTKGEALSNWLTDNFYILSPKTPKGQKAVKELANKLHWWLKSGIRMHKTDTPERETGLRNTIELTWKELEPHLDALSKYFSSEGGKLVPKELVLNGNKFINGAGLDEKKLAEYAGRLDSIFNDLKDWRKGALAGGVRVLFASPKDFGGGTAGGKYKTDQDTLMVRTTPDVLKRVGKAYAGFEYIIVHELGHRYERKHHLSVDFDKSEWWTTPYSQKEGEAFAELFALTNFGITRAHKTWDPAIIERFEKVVKGGTLKPELPEHLRKFMPTTTT